jgi:hypothetical protein
MVKIMSGWSETRSDFKPATRLVTHSLFSYSLLEDKPQSELEIAHLRARGQVENLTSFSQVTFNAVPGLPKVDVVEYVEALCSEL